MYYINIILFSVLVIPYTALYIKHNKLTPVSTFLIMEISMFYGICFYRGNTSVKGNSPVGVKLETIYVVALLFFIIGVEFAKHLKLNKPKGVAPSWGGKESAFFVDRPLNSTQRLIVWGMIIVSILACLYLLRKAGANLLLRALQDLLKDDNNVYRDERMAFGSIPGIGYIYQFRVIILPILTTYVVFAEKKLPSLLKCLLFVFMVFCILCTGQRNAFVFYCAILLFYYIFMKKQYGIEIISPRMVVVGAVAAFGLLAIMTVANGRVADSDNKLLAIISSIADRILFVNQGSALTAFSYIDTQETVWGYDWLQMLKQILPGKIDYMPVDNISYYIEYGTYAGTNPPCLWGSAWYNFNILGVTFYPFFIGLFYQKLYMKAKCKLFKNRMYILLYVALCVYLGIWVYGTPMTLFNQGVITVLLIRWLVCELPCRHKRL